MKYQIGSGQRNFSLRKYIKKRDPNPALLGGVKTFPNKKGLVRRMTMIQNALDRYDPGEYFTYP